MNTTKPYAPRFRVVVGDFIELGSQPLWQGDFPNFEDAHKKLEEVWKQHRQSGFDEKRAYIYEARQILNLENGTLHINNARRWIPRLNLAENWYKIAIGLLLCLGVFWFGVRPQVVRSQCAEKHMTSSGTLDTNPSRAYATCLKLHGLSN